MKLRILAFLLLSSFSISGQTLMVGTDFGDIFREYYELNAMAFRVNAHNTFQYGITAGIKPIKEIKYGYSLGVLSHFVFSRNKPNRYMKIGFGYRYEDMLFENIETIVSFENYDMINFIEERITHHIYGLDILWSYALNYGYAFEFGCFLGRNIASGNTNRLGNNNQTRTPLDQTPSLSELSWRSQPFLKFNFRIMKCFDWSKTETRG